MTRARFAVLAPAVLVAVGAVAATAHGLYEVAVAAGVPGPVAALYPVITDGLALVAYAATRQLPRVGYAWSVVVVAAGLSGMAQATYLAAGVGLRAGVVLRFGMGAWPAIAAAVVAHLVFLLAHRQTAARTVADLVAQRETETPSVPPTPPTTEDSGPGESPTRVALHLAPPPADTATPGGSVASPPGDGLADQPGDDDGDLAARVAEIVADGGGRATVVRELGVTPAVARRLLDEHRRRA